MTSRRRKPLNVGSTRLFSSRRYRSLVPSARSVRIRTSSSQASASSATVLPGDRVVPRPVTVLRRLSFFRSACFAVFSVDAVAVTLRTCAVPVPVARLGADRAGSGAGGVDVAVGADLQPVASAVHCPLGSAA